MALNDKYLRVRSKQAMYSAQLQEREIRTLKNKVNLLEISTSALQYKLRFNKRQHVAELKNQRSQIEATKDKELRKFQGKLMAKFNAEMKAMNVQRFKMVQEYNAAMKVNDKLRHILIKQEVDTYDNGLEPLADMRYKIGQEQNEDKAIILNNDLVKAKLQAEIQKLMHGNHAPLTYS